MLQGESYQLLVIIIICGRRFEDGGRHIILFDECVQISGTSESLGLFENEDTILLIARRIIYILYFDGCITVFVLSDSNWK